MTPEQIKRGRGRPSAGERVLYQVQLSVDQHQQVRALAARTRLTIQATMQYLVERGLRFLGEDTE